MNPLAVRAMAELGIDISTQRPKHLERFREDDWDYVITVCDRANEECPFFPGGKTRLHWSFEDPAAVQGTGAEKLAVFRQVRDQIRDRFGDFARQGGIAC